MKKQKFTRLVPIIGLLLLLSVWLWGTFSAAAELSATAGGPDSYLPAVFRPLPTPTPTATPLPTATPPPVNVIVNGNFEAGPTGWQQYSSNGWQLILQQANLPVPARSGTWAAWLGGDYDEASILSQMVTVPVGNSMLTYWLWIASEDVCGYDVGGVVINEDDAVDAYWLCADNNTGGWVRRDVNLGAYAGQSVLMDFAAFTDASLNSNMFLDDISLGLSLNVPAASETAAVDTAAADKAQVGLDAQPVATDAPSVAPLRALLHEALGGLSE
jgi:hypothetical protein